ncbi:MAG TPA: hypothetical protein VGM06_06650 [Polyangiaceae bacterium]
MMSRPNGSSLRVPSWTLWVSALLGAFLTACGAQVPDDAPADASQDGTRESFDASASDGPSDSGAPAMDAPSLTILDACTPITSCPPGISCGRFVDPCSGQSFACGAPCASGSVCVADPTSAQTQSCKPKACTGRCGVVGLDACGVAIACGGCSAGLVCVDGACQAVEAGASTAPDAGKCMALTCTPDPNTMLCGTVTDGCGHTMACACPAGQTCTGGVCGPIPPECTPDGGMPSCGTVANACGSGSIACPAKCSGATQCVKGACTPCTPPSCDGRACGSVSNGCGAAVSCGSCGSETCYDGGCCAPRTCAEALDAGTVTGCAPMDLGCGVTTACIQCGAGEVCSNDTCVSCTPKTCADFGNAGCGHANGCGGTLNCCAAGTACTGGLCCGAGEVAYNGSCCAPECDPSQPPGSQVSCGQVIFCSGSGGTAQ